MYGVGTYVLMFSLATANAAKADTARTLNCIVKLVWIGALDE